MLGLRDAHPGWGARKLACGPARAKRQCRRAASTGACDPARRDDRVIETAVRARAVAMRFEKAAPNLLWQMDFKGWVKLTDGSRCHPLTVVDDHSRYLVCLKACVAPTEVTVRGHLETAFRHHGLPEAMFVDNGSPWGGGPAERWTRFGVWLLKLGVGVLHSRPYHPQSRGKNERFHRTLNKEVLSMTCFRGMGEAQRAFDAWLPIYNGERPHEALSMAVPADRYRPSPRPMPARLMEPEYDERDIIRKVGTTKAYIQFKGRSWPVGQAFRNVSTTLIQPGSEFKLGS